MVIVLITQKPEKITEILRSCYKNNLISSYAIDEETRLD